MGVGQSTLSKWVRLYRDQGEAGLQSKPVRRNRQRPKVALAVKTEVVELKRRHPDLGIKKISRKITAANRLPASFFVSVAYDCWAFRRLGVLLDADSGAVKQWLYRDPKRNAQLRNRLACTATREHSPSNHLCQIVPVKPQVSIGSARAARKPRCKRILIARAFPIEAFVLSRCAEAMAIECRGSLAKR
jgi:hypothetical protein